MGGSDDSSRREGLRWWGERCGHDYLPPETESWRGELDVVLPLQLRIGHGAEKLQYSAVQRLWGLCRIVCHRVCNGADQYGHIQPQYQTGCRNACERVR